MAVDEKFSGRRVSPACENALPQGNSPSAISAACANGSSRFPERHYLAVVDVERHAPPLADGWFRVGIPLEHAGRVSARNPLEGQNPRWVTKRVFAQRPGLDPTLPPTAPASAFLRRARRDSGAELSARDFSVGHRYQPSAGGYPLTAVGDRLMAVGCRLMADGYRPTSPGAAPPGS